METNSSFSSDDLGNIFISKPKIIKNLPIQRPFLSSLKKPVQQKVIDKIVNDPELALIISPPVSKEDRHKVDQETQMTDREVKCPCSKRSLSHAANQTVEVTFDENSRNEKSKENDLKFELSTCDSKKIFESVNEASNSTFKYTSPLFKACGVSSQVFRQRVNFRVMKMNAFSSGKFL
jgi:hypothetical protein